MPGLGGGSGTWSQPSGPRARPGIPGGGTLCAGRVLGASCPGGLFHSAPPSSLWMSPSSEQVALGTFLIPVAMEPWRGRSLGPS